jgi:hypothetical protein
VHVNVGKTIDNGKNGHKILKLAGNVGTDDMKNCIISKLYIQ